MSSSTTSIANTSFKESLNTDATDSTLINDEDDKDFEEILSQDPTTNRLDKLLHKVKKAYEEIRSLWMFNSRMRKVVQHISKENDALKKSLNQTTKELHDLNQYNRRPNIEIRNITENINQRDLEPYIIDLLKSINVNVSSYEIVAVHRLGRYVSGKSRPVIVRFINRKAAYIALENQHMLRKNPQYNKMFITENLCPIYKNVFNKLYKAKKEKKIANVWTRNGLVHVKTDIKERNSTIIRSIEEADNIIGF